LSPGGFLIVDDYGTYEACQRAISEYRTANGITDEIVKIDDDGVYWRKS
jgi:O-methyltransferase